MIIKKILYILYGINIWRIQSLILKIITRIENGQKYSTTLRAIFKHYYGVEIGLYTDSGCFTPGMFDRYTTVGRYCSIARGVRVINRNHPTHFKSTHSFFYNPTLKLTSEDKISYIPISIGNDVWIGHNAIILPNTRIIGDGAVIGAGAVVNKNVPPYAIVVGNPARVVLYRFSKNVIDELLASKWWEKSIEEISKNIQEFQRPYEEQSVHLLNSSLQ